MATIYDLIEVTGIAANTTYSAAAGNLLGVIDGATSADLNDGEFDEGDLLVLDGVSYTIDRIQEPSSSGRFTLVDGTNRSFNPGSESNLPAVFLTVSNGSAVRHFILPNDSYGSMNIAEIRTGSLTDVAGSDAGVISTTNNAVNIMCFVAGTMIATGDGEVAVEDFRRGDPVLTRDHGLQEIRIILRQDLDLNRAPERLKPIAFEPGSLGKNRPSRKLCLSPQHRVLVSDRSGTPVLVPARALLGHPGVRIMQSKRHVSYLHLVFSRHEIIWANGAPTESFFPGRIALRALSSESLAEVCTLYGCSPTRDQETARPTVTPVLAVNRARRAGLMLG